MSFELFYAVFSAPLLMLSAGVLAVAMHRLQDRRDRRLDDEQGWPRPKSESGQR